MNFTEIDFKTWARAGMFYYFSKQAPTGYSLTVKLDVTRMRRYCKERGIKFFPVYLWLCTKDLSTMQEFKIAYKDGRLGYYDTLTPLYPCFHEDTRTVSLMWTEYSDSFGDFYRRYMDNRERYSENHGVLAQENMLPPENSYTISCIPWLDFTHFAVHSYENKPYFFPSLEAGKIVTENGRDIMLLSLTCHHASTDGYHVSQFISALQNDLDNIEIM